MQLMKMAKYFLILNPVLEEVLGVEWLVLWKSLSSCPRTLDSAMRPIMSPVVVIRWSDSTDSCWLVSLAVTAALQVIIW